MSMAEFLAKEVVRMEQDGYTAEEIKKQINSYLRVQSLVTWTLIHEDGKEQVAH